MNLSQEQQNRKILVGRGVTLTLLLVMIVFVVLYLVGLNSSLGWLAEKNDSDAVNTAVSSLDEKYDIFIDRATEYDATLAGGAAKYEGVADLKTELASVTYGYDLTEDSTRRVSSLAYELKSEVVYTERDVNFRYLMPGSCGTVTLYLRPRADEDVEADIYVSVGGFANVLEEGVQVIRPVEDQAVLDLLRGHILLFTERQGNAPENYRYAGLLTDGHFQYSTTGKAKSAKPGRTDCYEITLYWEWPQTFQDIADNTGATDYAAKYPPALADFVDENRDCFFAVNQNSADPEDLKDGYNDGDQTIGEHVNYITAVINPY